MKSVFFPQVLVLNYHHVHEGADHSFRVTPQQLQRQLSCLLEEGFRPIHLEEMIRLKGTTRVKGKPVFITFDDGYENFLSHAWPILKAFKIPCTVFLISHYLDKWNDWDPLRKVRYKHLDPAQIQTLLSEGLTFGSHSNTHPNLTRLKRRLLSLELGDSKRMLETILGVAIKVFAYPGGHSNNTVHKETERYYELGFSSKLKAGVQPNQPYCIPRIDVSFCSDLEAFQAQLRPYI